MEAPLGQRKRKFNRKMANQLRLQVFTLAGAVLGAALGVPVSYRYQSWTLQLFVSMGDYCHACFAAIQQTLLGGASQGSAPQGVVTTLLMIMAMGAVLGAVAGAVASQLQWRK